MIRRVSRERVLSAALLILILWVGTGLRLYDLESKSLRGDEIFTDLRSAQRLSEIVTMSNLEIDAGGR